MLSREKLERLVKLVLEETTEEATSLLNSILSKYSDSEISSLLASTLSSVSSKDEEVETTSEKTELVCDSTEEVDKEEGYQPSIRMGKYTPYEEKLDLALEFREECADVDPSFYTTKPAVLEAVKESSKAEEDKCENSEVVEEVKA